MFLFNKKTPKRINFNGFHVAEVIYNGITVWIEKILTLISGKAPLTLDASIGEDVIDYQIYGESVQEATPSLTIPVEVECVGDYDEASGKYKIPIVARGKNLFDIKKYEASKDSYNAHYIDISNLEVGKYYTISSSEICIFKAAGHAGGSAANTNGFQSGKVTEYKFKMTESLKNLNNLYIIHTSYRQATLDEVKAYNIQIEKDSAATEYEPYHEPVTSDIYLDKPLCKIGSYADYIDFENKKVIRKVGIQEFDENDVNGFAPYALANREFYGFSRTISDMKEGKFQKGLSTYFYNQENIDSRIWFGSASVNNLVYFSIPEAYSGGTNTSTRRQALAEWFKGLKTPFMIYYILATPTEKTIELPDIPTFKGKTIIEVNTNITPNIAIEYYKQGG